MDSLFLYSWDRIFTSIFDNQIRILYILLRIDVNQLKNKARKFIFPRNYWPFLLISICDC